MKPDTHFTVDLLRHGEIEGGSRFCGSTDSPLTERGWMQLQEAVENTDKRTGNASGWQRIISSPLSRCADFARQLSEEQQLPMTFDERFREMHFGDWEGFSAADLMTTHADALSLFWNDPETNTPPQAESLPDFADRVITAWHEMLVEHAGQRTLLVTHGGVIRTILCHVLQHPIQRLLELEVIHASMHRVHVQHSSQGFQYSLSER